MKYLTQNTENKSHGVGFSDVVLILIPTILGILGSLETMPYASSLDYYKAIPFPALPGVFSIGLFGSIVGTFVMALCLAVFVLRHKKLGPAACFIPFAAGTATVFFMTGKIFFSLLCGFSVFGACLMGSVCGILLNGGAGKAEAASAVGAAGLLGEALFFCLTVNTQALTEKVKFSTCFIETVDNTVSSLAKELYALMSAVPADAPQGVIQVSENMLYTGLAAIAVLFPAVIMAFYTFFGCFLTGGVSLAARKSGTEFASRDEEYGVGGVTSTVFSITTTIAILTLLFSGRFATFHAVILSIVIALAPHFIILGYRRICRLLCRVVPKAAAIVIAIVSTLFIFSLAPLILLFLLITFGTSEYRSMRNRKLMR